MEDSLFTDADAAIAELSRAVRELSLDNEALMLRVDELENAPQPEAFQLALRVDDLENAPPPEAPQRWWVTPDDAPEDEDALQWAMNPKEQTHVKPVVLIGYFDTEKKIVTGTRHGLSLYCGGIQQDNMKPNDQSRGCVSVIEWKGDQGGTIWENRGSGTIINGGLTLDGKGKAKVGLQIKRQDKGASLNPCKSIYNLAVLRCEDGVVLGDAPRQHGSDNFYPNFLYFQDCDRGLRIRTEQSMDHAIRTMFLRRTKVAIWVDEGGRFNVDSITAVEGTKELLHIVGKPPHSGRDIGGIGHVNGSMWLRNIKIDTRAGDCMLVNQENVCGLDVRIDGGQVANPTPGVKVRLRPRAKCTIDHYRSFGGGSFEIIPDDSGRIANINLRRCTLGKFPLKDLVTLQSKGYRIEVEKCYDNDGNSIPDEVVTG